MSGEDEGGSANFIAGGKEGGEAGEGVALVGFGGEDQLQGIGGHGGVEWSGSGSLLLGLYCGGNMGWMM